MNLLCNKVVLFYLIGGYKLGKNISTPIFYISTLKLSEISITYKIEL